MVSVETSLLMRIYGCQVPTGVAHRHMRPKPQQVCLNSICSPMSSGTRSTFAIHVRGRDGGAKVHA